jgi:hypothetical protein
MQLDGRGSYDPDRSGPLSYAWTQVSGPSVVIVKANTATPLVGGFVQTEQIQKCTFQLIVHDGELASGPDTVDVIVVPLFGVTTLKLENVSFDPNKPTFIYFGGGDCVNGYSGQPWGQAAWLEKANVIGFPDGYVPDTSGGACTYYRYGDMIVAYLSAVAPNYEQPIQTAGHSTGGQPAIDVGLRLNLTYKDARYAVNRVTFLDATSYCRASYQEDIDHLLAGPVDGEQCWIDNYVGTLSGASGKNNVLNVWFDQGNDTSLASTERHRLPRNWYRGYVAAQDANQFNHGVVAGAYWSVVGPGKNLQLASSPGARTYHFTWYGDALSGHMELYDGQRLPACLPEPVTLVGPEPGATIDFNGTVLTCRPSENAVGYQLLSGADPKHMVYLLSDTPSPPNERVTSFPFERTYWTVRAYDRFGSAIDADPSFVRAATVTPQTIQNSSTGQTYASIQQAINHAHDGDEIILHAGIWRYQENLDFKGKSLTLRSAEPNNASVVAATILAGGPRVPVVTLSSSAGESPTLNGLTITGGTTGVSCRDAVPTIRNCVVQIPDGVALEFWTGREPRLIGCTVLGQVKEVADPGLIAYWKLDEAAGMTAADSAGTNHGTLFGAPSWQSAGGKIGGALKSDGGPRFVITKFVCDPSKGPFSVFAWVKGGAPGQTILSQTGITSWLMAAAPTGALAGLGLSSSALITDGVWHRVGFAWNGSNRILYVDGVEVARDTVVNLPGSTAGLYLGGSHSLAPGTFWSGLIDDVRIYNRAVRP